MDKRERELRKLLKRKKCRIDGKTGSSHWRIICRKTGRAFTASMTPSDEHTWLKQVRRDIRRIRKGVYDASA